MNHTIGTMDMLKILKEKWYVVLLFFVVGLIGAYSLSAFVMTPRYASNTRILVNRSYNAEQVLDIRDIETNIQLINTYRDIIEDPVILNEVQTTLNTGESLEDLRDNIAVQIQEDSQLFTIVGTSTSPQQAARLTNTVAEVFQKNIGEIMEVDNVAILSPAIAEPDPVSPRLLLNIFLGGVIGAMAGFLFAVGRTLLNTTVSDEAEVAELLGWTSLGAVTEVPKKERTNQTSLSSHPESEKPALTNKTEGEKRYV